MKKITKRAMRYLSGLDWVISAMDVSIGKSAGAGNTAEIVLELESRPDPAIFTGKVREFTAKFHLLSGRISRSWLTLAPYWRMPGENMAANISVSVSPLPVVIGGRSVIELLGGMVNSPFRDRNDHLAFHLFISERGPDYLVMVFDHRLFDAKGAELFLGKLADFLAGNECEVSAGLDAYCARAGLTAWMDKLVAGRAPNRMFLKLRSSLARVLPLARINTRTRFRVVQFDRLQTERILEKSGNEAGPFMEMPFLLSRAVQAFDLVFSRRGVEGGSYMIPVTVDIRPPGEEFERVFFNYASFMFLNLPVSAVSSRGELIRGIKAQVYEQVKDKFPEKLAKSAMLMRILPLKVFSGLVEKMMGGRMSSFTFGYLGEARFLGKELAGCPVKGLFQMPRVPGPPGLGLFVQQFDGKLNAVLSYQEGGLLDEEADVVMSAFRESLLS